MRKTITVLLFSYVIFTIAIITIIIYDVRTSTNGMDVVTSNTELVSVNNTLAEGEVKIDETLELELPEVVTHERLIDYTRINESPYILEAIIQKWKEHEGTYILIPLVICKYESNFNTFTLYDNGKESSYGLFQINVADAWHAKRMQYRNYERLYDMDFNMNYQFPELVFYEKEGISRGLHGAELAQYVARYGQRPVWSDTLAKQIETYYKTFEEVLM